MVFDLPYIWEASYVDADNWNFELCFWKCNAIKALFLNAVGSIFDGILVAKRLSHIQTLSNHFCFFGNTV